MLCVHACVSRGFSPPGAASSCIAGLLVLTPLQGVGALPQGGEVTSVFVGAKASLTGCDLGSERPWFNTLLES